MMNSYIPLCFIALVATIQTMPSIVNYNRNNNNYNSSKYDDTKSHLVNDDYQHDQYQNTKTSRHLQRVVNGAIHRIRTAGVTYRQRLRDEQCVVEYDNQYLTENSVLQVRKKLYRVENCLLERVFHACGPNLLLMLNVVCRVVEQQQTTTPMTARRRQTSTTAPLYIHRLYPRASKKSPRVITESCCENLCTISELTRYCHR